MEDHRLPFGQTLPHGVFGLAGREQHLSAYGRKVAHSICWFTCENRAVRELPLPGVFGLLVRCLLSIAVECRVYGGGHCVCIEAAVEEVIDAVALGGSVIDHVPEIDIDY